MRRLLTALVFGTAISLFCVIPSSAEPTPVDHTQVVYSSAEAFWNIDPDNSDGMTHFVGLRVARSSSAAFLFAEDVTQRWLDGRPAGTTQTHIDVSSGFTFSGQRPLKSATLRSSEEGLPAKTCNYDVNGFEVPGSCTDTRVVLEIDWIGVGEITRDVSTFHIGPPMLPDQVVNAHDIVFAREATATGKFNSQELGASDLAFLGTANSGFLCVDCPS
jgi:hypothetical protein